MSAVPETARQGSLGASPGNGVYGPGQGLEGRLRSRLKFGPALIVVPGVLWLVLFYILPNLVMVRFSLLSQMPRQGPAVLTPAHYLEAFQTSVYAKVLVKSAGFAGLTTFSLLILCFPVAYYLAKKTLRQKELLILLMIPFWTSQVLRAFAWLILLSRTGLVNSTLLGLHLIPQPLQLIYNWQAVSAGLIYSYLPYMILPLYATLGKIDDALLEASADLGANRWQTLLTVTVPLALPGIVSAVAVVFVASLTDVLSPTLLGGPYDQMISSTIFNIFTKGSNWPLGAALSMLLFVVLLLVASAIMGLNRRVRYEAEV
jgi:spermidine/putrescine transport system permease protein